MYSDCVQDDIVYFNGVKTNNKWYFFSAGSLVLIRNYYQKDIHKPLSWELMGQIAASQLCRGYLKPDGDINEYFFDEFTSGAWGKAETQSGWDSVYLDIIKRNWQEK